MIKNNIEKTDIKRILSNTANYKEFLKRINIEFKKTIKTQDAMDLIINSYNYGVFKDQVRDMFSKLEKFDNGKKAWDQISVKLDEWKDLELGEVKWPCNQAMFDAHIQRINNSNMSEAEKDEMASKDALRFRRIKDLNTLRNDFIETLVYELYDEIIPTIAHRKTGDYYIDGVKFDQKVAKSPGKDYKELLEAGKISIEDIKKDPVPLIRWMYENQGEDRFDNDNRLYVIYLKNGHEVTADFIKDCISKSDIINTTYDIDFKYKHSGNKVMEYSAKAKVILIG